MTTSEGGSERRPQTRLHGGVRVLGVLLGLGLLAGWATAPPATPAQTYQRARSILAGVADTPGLVDTVHADPGVLRAIGAFLPEADAANVAPVDIGAEFARIVPVPPWKWMPIVEFHKVGPGLYLVAVGHAAATQPSSLYLFDGAHYVTLASDETAALFFEQVAASERRVEVTYWRMPPGYVPEWTTAVAEKVGQTWHIVGSK